MFIEQIANACVHFPKNNQERFLLYPALAVYSPLENLVKTVVGIIFTALSVVSLGLCPSINKIANWTRYSRGLLTIPLQIVGNIFELHSRTLTDFNITSPNTCLIGNLVLPVFINNPKIDEKEIPEKIKDRIDEIDKKAIADDLADIRLTRARKICTKLFQTRTEFKIQLLAKHIIFRAYSVLNGMMCVSVITLFRSIFSIYSIPFVVYNRGKDAKLNHSALYLPKIPEHIHTACLTIRMIVNPLQFVNESSKELELDKSPIINALAAPGDFWMD